MKINVNKSMEVKMMYLFGVPLSKIPPSIPPIEVSLAFNALREVKGLSHIRLHYITRDGLNKFPNLGKEQLVVGKLGLADIENNVCYVVEGERYGWLEDTIAAAIHELMHFYLGVGHGWMKKCVV